MQMHASCAARHGQGVLVLGPAGSGKSSLILSLISAGFTLVADDRVTVSAGVAEGPAALAGLLEVRGVGIVRLPYLRRVSLRLVVTLDRARTPLHSTGDITGVQHIVASGPGAAAAIGAALSRPGLYERGI